jgi:hypothetical protein
VTFLPVPFSPKTGTIKPGMRQSLKKPEILVPGELFHSDNANEKDEGVEVTAPVMGYKEKHDIKRLKTLIAENSRILPNLKNVIECEVELKVQFLNLIAGRASSICESEDLRRYDFV